MKIETKFNAGDIVRFKYGGKTKLFIHEALTQTCYQFSQIFYLVRGFRDSGYDKFESKDLLKVREDEIEEVPAYSKQYQELRDRIEAKKKEKELAIINQNWEEAAKFRDEERKLKETLELYSD